MTSVTRVSFHNVVTATVSKIGGSQHGYTWREILLTDKDGNQLELTMFGNADALNVTLPQEDECPTP